MSVLFVDDDPQVIRGLERMLDSSDLEWEYEFAFDAEEALRAIGASREIDTIVTDMKMPVTDGAALLQKVSDRYPQVVRIILSGQADKEAVFRAVSPMHQYLSKPCDAGELKQTINRARATVDILSCDKLQKLVAGVSQLPSVPVVYQKLIEALKDEDVTSTTLGEIVSQDPAMTIKLLQISNSSVFGLRRSINSAAEATTILGINTVKSLALSVGVFQQFEGNIAAGFSLDTMMNHAIEVATNSQAIARSESLDREATNTAFSAAMVHDIGKLVLATGLTEEFTNAISLAKTERIPLWQAERETIGVDHASIGAHLMNIWGLPQSIVEIVALHHTPFESKENEFSALTAVSAANHLTSQNRNRTGSDQELSEYLTHIGCNDKLNQWDALINPTEQYG